MQQGVIGKVLSKPWGNKKFYSFTLSGQDGFFNTGVKQPPQEGTSVRFNSKVNTKGYTDVDGSIEIVTDGAVEQTGSVGAVVKAAGSAKSANGVGNSGAYWDRKESRDIHNDELREIGASRNTAIAIIDLMIKHEAVKLPAAAKREEFIWTLLDRYTNKLRGKGEALNSVTTVTSEQVEKLADKITKEVVNEEWN